VRLFRGGYAVMEKALRRRAYRQVVVLVLKIAPGLRFLNVLSTNSRRKFVGKRPGGKAMAVIGGTGGLTRWLDRLISPLCESDARQPSSMPRHATAGSLQAELTCPDTRERLRAILQGQTRFTAGCFHLIGLAALKDRLGARWAAVERRVQQLMERLLAQHLHPADAWFRHGSETYVVVFATLNKLEAQLLCGKVMQELHELLLGDSDTADIVVETAVMDAGGGLAVESRSLQSLLSSALDGYHEEGRAPPADPGWHRASGGESRRPVREVPGWAVEEEPEAAPDILYRPIWDARNQVISTYLCRPKRRRPGGIEYWGYDVLRDPADSGAIADLDLEILSHSVSLLQELVRNKFRLMMTLPVHFETMAVLVRRRQYLQLCRMIPRQIVGFLAFELNGLPPGIPASRLIELVNALKPYARVILARADLAHADPAAAATGGIKVVGIAMPTVAEAVRHHAEIARFAAAARKHHLLTFADHVDGEAVSALAEQAGFDFLLGDFVGPWCDVPETAVRRSRDDLAGRFRVKAPGRRY